MHFVFLVYVRFGQSSYTVTESQELKATLILSKPLSTNVTIQVIDSVSSAFSKLCMSALNIHWYVVL